MSSIPSAGVNLSHQRTASTRELGLDLALIAARYLIKTDHLHYGYWPEDLPVEIANLKRAQELHSELIVSHIPEGVRTVLDVGTGTGALARRLIDAGYEVECVSPSPNLTQHARALLGERAVIHECKFEDLQVDRRFDLVLFSESFQYIKMAAALENSLKHMMPGGYLLICDFFRNDTPDRGPFGGGHPLKDFNAQVETLPLQRKVDTDITARTAPNLDLVADFTANVVVPLKDHLLRFVAVRYPLPSRFLRWVFRKKLARAEEKYFTGQRSGANFMIYKSYRLMLFQGP